MTDKINDSPIEYPVSFAQKRMFLLNQLHNTQTSYNLPFMIRITGKIDYEKLQNAFHRIIQRHEILRTSYHMNQGNIFQHINATANFNLRYYKATTDQLDKIRSEFIKPFDMSQPPLFRAELVELDETQYGLLIDMHHSISDGISIQIFNQELIDLYTGKELPELKSQYRDYVIWEKEFTDSAALQDQEHYWLNKFSVAPPPLELPLDYPRPALQTFNGKLLKRFIVPDMVTALNQLAFKNRITLNVMLIAVYCLLLSEYTGQEEFAVGTAVSGRQRPELRKAIGLFVNTLPLLIKINKGYSIPEFLKQMGEEVFEAIQNQDYPFDLLIERLNIGGDRSRNPLVDTMLLFHNQTGQEQVIETGAFKFSMTRMLTDVAVADLVLDAYLENDGSLECCWQYNADLFRAETINRMANHFEHIIRGILDDPEQKIGALELITEDEKQRLLIDFNDTRADYPKDKTIHQLFEEQVEKTPDNMAVFVEGRGFSYRELNEKADQLARGLRSKGVGPESIVGIMVERSWEMLAGIFGILKAGGAYLPIDPAYPAERIRYILVDSAAKIVLTRGRVRDEIKFEGETLDLTEERLYRGENSDLEKNSLVMRAHANNLAYVIYTSGSTGKPKGTMIEHYSAVNRLHWMQKEYRLTPDDAILQKTPITFDVSVWELFWWAISGARVCLLSPGAEKDPGQIIAAIQQNRITTIHFVPSMLNAFLEYLEGHPEAVSGLSSLRQVFASGEALTARQVERFKSILFASERTKLHNLYGPTEATVDVSYFDCSGGEKLQTAPIGKPIDNIRLHIIDQNQRLQPVGVAGELCIAGDGLARGYLNQPDLTAEKFIPDPFDNTQELGSFQTSRIYRTGDSARWLPDGNVDFLGRIDNQVKLRGFRIELGEIESRLLKHGSIREAVVIVKEDNNGNASATGNTSITGDKYLCAYLVAGPPNGDSNHRLAVSELREYLSQELPEYMIPTYFMQLDKLPLTPNGKVDRKALAANGNLAAIGNSADTGKSLAPGGNIRTGVEYVAPQNEIEAKLVTIWQGVLGIEKIGTGDNFLVLGGHSLKATILVSRIYKEFNVEVPLHEIFEKPTIRELAAYIRGAESNMYAAIPLVESKEYYPVSSAQKRLYIIDKLEGAGTSYNMPQVYVIEGNLDRERFEAAFQGLVMRHETLRTSFEMNQGEPVQRVHEELKLAISYQTAAEADVKSIVQGFIRSFDLKTAPLLRVGLVRINDTKHILLYDMHHIISDGVSMGMLIREFISLYQGELPAGLRIQYKDFAAWQNELFLTDVITNQEEFWVKTFSGEIPVLNLAADYARPAVQSFEGEKTGFQLGVLETEKLNQLAVETGSTLFMVLLACYTILLSKYTGQEDIIVGSPIAGRPHADLEKIIGMFVNTLAMRNYPEADKTFQEFLKEVRENALRAYENQDYQFEELVDKLNIMKDLSRNPLFDTMFVLQNFDHGKTEISGLAITPYRFENKITKFDLTLQAFGSEQGIYFELEYCTRLFKPETMQRMAGHFIQLIEAVIKNPTFILSQLEMISEAEKQQILHEFNNTQSDYPKDKTIHKLFEEQVARRPEAIALTYQELHLTYGELNRRSNQLARVLRDKGVKADTIVGIMAEKSFEMIIGILGVLKSGGAYLPIDSQYPIERVRFMLADSEARILLTQSHIQNKYVFHQEIVKLDNAEIYSRESTDLAPINCSRDLAYVIYTSGSTGKPKGVLVEHQGFINLLYCHRRLFQRSFLTEDPFQENRTWNMSLVSSPGFDAMALELFPGLIFGNTLFLALVNDLADPLAMKKWFQKNNIEFTFQSTAIAERMFEIEYAPAEAMSLQKILTGGDRLRRYPSAKVPFEVYNLYGPTENTVVTTWYKVDPAAEHQTEFPPIGTPLSNQQVYILDQFNNLQPIGIPGELCIGGAGLARGYLNRPDLTTEKFVPNPNYTEKFRVKSEEFRIENQNRNDFNELQLSTLNSQLIYKTGDLARWLPDGKIEFLGRLDHQVKIRGFRIELGEIENQLLSYKPVKEAVVIARENPNGTTSETGATGLAGEKYLCAYLVAERELTTPEIREYLGQMLPEYMIPTYFIQLERLPLTSSGKIDRKALPEPDGNIPTGIEYQAPRDEIEETLVAIWQNVLGVGKIGILDNFFALGGHSLKATIVIARLYQELNVEVPLREMFQAPTIRELAEYIRGVESSIHRSIEAVEKREYYPASSAQKRLYILEQFEGIGTSYNIPLNLEFTGELDRELLETVFRRLVSRHEAFRTSFEMVEGELVQRIHPRVNFGIEYLEASETEVDGLIREFNRPFILGQAPLIRVKLVKLDPRKHLLCCIMHHIIADGTSLGILVNELNSLYRGEELAELRIQYKDFAVWQNKLFEQGTVHGQEEYWLSKFRDSVPVLNLPTDYPRPAVQDFSGDIINFHLNFEETAALMQIALGAGATINMVLLAIFIILLYRYSGQEDILIGQGIAGRHHADLESVVGMFINMLVLRTYPTADKNFREFLAEVKEITLEAFENQDYQFEALVEKVDLERNLNRNPLFDVSFVTQNMNIPGFELKDLEYKPYYGVQNRTSKFDITLFAVEMAYGIHLSIEYCAGLFKAETIQRMAGHYQNIVRGILADPEQKIAAIDLLSDTEKQKLVFDFNDTRTDFPATTIQRLFEEQADKAPENIALASCEEQITYKELDQKANQVARYLLAQQIQPDMLVGVMLENSIDQVIAIIGVLKAGAGYLPIDPGVPEERIKHIINDAGVKIVISSKQHLRVLNRLQWESPVFQRYLCLDSTDIHAEEEEVKSELMNVNLWDHVAKTALDEVGGGGWVSSYTGENLSRQEMDEYADNVLTKLRPYLDKKSRVLEIGCASGITMYRIAPSVDLYYGTDISPEMIAGNLERAKREGLTNIKLATLTADKIDRLEESGFDLVIINSVIQCFHGHNYLRKVITKAIALLKEKGILFIGDIMDQDRKADLLHSLQQFKQADVERRYQTKSDVSTELFISKGFFEDLQSDLAEIAAVKCADKIYTIENELTRFRFDAIIEIDKRGANRLPGKRHKYQDDLNKLGQFGVGRVSNQATPQNIAYVIYTSGTSGKPKGIVIEHRSICNTLQWRCKEYQMAESDHVLQLFNVSFDGFLTGLFTPLLSGAQTYILNKDDIRNPVVIKSTIAVKNITRLLMVPSLYQVILDVAAPEDFQSLRSVTLAGETVRKEILQISKDKKPSLEIINEYGPTENSVATTIKRDLTSDATITIGRPIANTKIYILSAANELMPIGVPGEICITGKGLARGYLKNEPLTAAKFVPNPFSIDGGKHLTVDIEGFTSGVYLTPEQLQTSNFDACTRLHTSRMYRSGDLARWLPDGNIEFLGRIDHQVKIRGYRIEMGEIESQLLKIEAIKECVVIVKKDSSINSYLYAYITTGKELITTAELRELLSRELPDYMIPSYFIQLEQLPRTVSGKIDHKALSKIADSHDFVNTGVEYIAPGTDLERIIAGIWQEVLQYDRIGVNDNFFDVGGNSISLIKALSLLNQRLPAEQTQKISLTTLFQYTTIHMLAQYLYQAPEDVDQEESKKEQVLEERKHELSKFLNTIKERTE